MNKESMRILAFDPGELTGIAFLKDNEFIWGIVTSKDGFGDNLMLSLHKMVSPTHVVIETPPTDGKIANSTQMFVFHYVVRWFEAAGISPYKIPPGLWKGIVKTDPISTTHIRDCVGMAKWIYKHEEVKNAK